MRQGSTIPNSSMKCLIILADFESVFGAEDELSRWGLIQQLKSPPNIKLNKLRSGNNEKKCLKKLSSSQFGA